MQKPVKTTESHFLMAGAGVLVLLSFFLWSTLSVLSPLLIGTILLLFLSSFSQFLVSRRLSLAVAIVLAIWIFMKAQAVFVPLLFAFILAYLFDPMVDLLQKIKMPRTLGVCIVLVVIFGLLVLIGATLVPSLVDEIQDLIKRSDKLPEKIFAFIEANLPKVLRFVRADTEKLKENLTGRIPAGFEQLLSNLLKGVAGVGSFVGQIFNLVLIPVLTFYLLKDFDKIQSWFMGMMPKQKRGIVSFYLWRFNRILGGYLRAQVIVCIFVGTLTGFGLALLRVPFAILIGVVTGLLNIIPFVGFYSSLALSILISFLSPDPLMTLIKIMGVFLTVQVIEAYIVSPKIVGERVGLHPVAVIFSVLVFSRFFGFWGLLIGVPTAAILKFFMDEWRRHEERNALLGDKHGA